jgi:hypothetical protein
LSILSPGRHRHPITGSVRYCISPSCEYARNTGHGTNVHGLIISIPCSFHPAGIVSVAATILFSEGSAIVAVVVWFDNGVALTYVAVPAEPGGVPEPSPDAAGNAAAAFDVEEQPAIDITVARANVNGPASFFIR